MAPSTFHWQVVGVPVEWRLWIRQNTSTGRTKVSGSAIYPDYWTQGQSLEDLESHLRDLYQDLTSGEIPGVRKLAELSLRR
jgi:hypothetical protein